MVSCVRKQQEDVTFFSMLHTLVTTAVANNRVGFSNVHQCSLPHLQKEGFQLCVQSKMAVTINATEG
jgi:hypothetical protein